MTVSHFDSKALSFHAVSFGPHTRTLRRMAEIAQSVERDVPQDQLNRQGGVPSSYTEALDTVSLLVYAQYSISNTYDVHRFS